MITPLSPVNFV